MAGQVVIVRFNPIGSTTAKNYGVHHMCRELSVDTVIPRVMTPHFNQENIMRTIQMIMDELFVYDMLIASGDKSDNTKAKKMLLEKELQDAQASAVLV